MALSRYKLAKTILLSALLIFPAMPSQAQSRDFKAVCLRFDCPVEQTRKIITRLDQQKAQINSLSRQYRISKTTLEAIAFELGLRKPGMGTQQYLRLIRASAQEAGKLKITIANLRQQVSLLEDAQLRDPANVALEQAQLALAEGDLLKAEEELEKLKTLRTSELAGAQTAWLEAVKAEAGAAHLRGDAKKRRRLLHEALEFTREHAKRQQWRLNVQDASYLLADGDLKGDNAALLEAIRVFRDAALPLVPRDRAPRYWAGTQINLGVALSTMGERESDKKKLQQAEQAFRGASEIFTLEQSPQNWALLQNNLGGVLRNLGERDSDNAKLLEAVEVFRNALVIRTRETIPLGWAATKNNLGNALATLGKRTNDAGKLEQAVAVYREALKERTRSRVPSQWAKTKSNLGNAHTNLGKLGEPKDRKSQLRKAIDAYSDALNVRTRERVPLQWAMTQVSLGNTLSELGKRERGRTRLKLAIMAYTSALEELTRERVPLDWAMTQNNLGNVLLSLGMRERGTERLEQAISAFHAALELRTRENLPYQWITTSTNLSNTLTFLARKTQNRQTLMLATNIIQSIRPLVTEEKYKPHLPRIEFVELQIKKAAEENDWQLEGIDDFLADNSSSLSQKSISQPSGTIPFIHCQSLL